MSEFDHGNGHGRGNAFGHDKRDEAGFDLAGENRFSSSSSSGSKGSDLQSASIDEALAGAIEDPDTANSSGQDNQEAASGELEPGHFSADQLANVRQFDEGLVERTDNLNSLKDPAGDSINGLGGNNVVIAGNDGDLIFSNTEGANNLATTGSGKDAIVLGPEATIDILDFDPSSDRFVLTGGLTLDRIIGGQGTSAEKGGLEQPADSENNALFIDNETGHALAITRFTDIEDFSEENFVVFDESAAPDHPEQS